LISVITRSGKNTPHGSAFWFHRNDNLDAATTFEARSTTGKSEFKRNHFGGTLGGPIIKNRTFFFLSYQGLRQIRPSLVNSTVETLSFVTSSCVRVRTRSPLNCSGFPAPAQSVTNIRDIGVQPGVRVFNPLPDGIPDIGEVFIPIPGFVYDDQFSVRLTTHLTAAMTLSRDVTASTTAKNSAPATAPVPSGRFLEKDTNIS
jgi:hypothetical protein